MKKLTIALVFIAISCKNTSSEKKFEKLDQLGWLIGKWENKMGDGLLIEKWDKENDSTFSGNSFFIKNSRDTIHFESIKLTQAAEDVIYTATVIGQNDNKPVDFKLTSVTEKVYSFENPNHDYPKKIVYNKISDDSLVATISGTQQGKESQESFPMKKKIK